MNSDHAYVEKCLLLHIVCNHRKRDESTGNSRYAIFNVAKAMKKDQKSYL